MPTPPKLMVGSGVNAMGSGFELAAQTGGTASRLDHQWNYPRGIPDPRFPGTNRGLSLNPHHLPVDQPERQAIHSGANR